MQVKGLLPSLLLHCCANKPSTRICFESVDGRIQGEWRTSIHCCPWTFLELVSVVIQGIFLPIHTRCTFFDFFWLAACCTVDVQASPGRTVCPSPCHAL